MAAKNRVLNQISDHSVGENDAKQWMAHGYALRSSARVLRAAWVANRRKLKRCMRIYKEDINTQLNSLSLFDYDKHLPGPSLLLLGYAAELFLKACVAKVMSGCSEQLFHHQTKNEFSHNLVKIAQFIELPLSKERSEDLKALEKYILQDGRYPFSAANKMDFITKHNERRRSVADAKIFKRLCSLVDEISRFAHGLSGSRGSPVSKHAWTVHDDGYIAYRRGGGISTRITYRLSRELENEPDPVAALRDLVRNIPSLDRDWEAAKLYEDLVETKVTLKTR